MNCDTGELIKFEDPLKEEQIQQALSSLQSLSGAERRVYMANMMEEEKPFASVEEKHLPMLKHQSRARRKNWMRNRPCPCGSGKKFKKCCWGMFTD